MHVARRDGRLVGALPLVGRRAHGLRVASFVGAADSALADLLLAEPSDARPPTHWSQPRRQRTTISPICSVCPPPAGWPPRSGRAGSQMVPRVPAPVLDLAEGWEVVYRDRVSTKHRKAHRRSRRQLAAMGRLQTSLAATALELGPSLDEAFALHALRWRDRPDGSGFATEAGRGFQRDALLAVAGAGIPRIVTLRLDARPIAFTAFFLLGDTMILHRLAFDPELARWSPGTLVMHDALAIASAHGARRVELLGGAEPYKRALTDRGRTAAHRAGPGARCARTRRPRVSPGGHHRPPRTLHAARECGAPGTGARPPRGGARPLASSPAAVLGVATVLAHAPGGLERLRLDLVAPARDARAAWASRAAASGAR